MNETGIPSVDRHDDGAEEDPVEGGSAASALGAPLPEADEEPTHPAHRSDPESPAGPMDPNDLERPAGSLGSRGPGEPTPAGPMP